MSDGFLGRWSRRKLDAKEGKPLPAESLAEQEPQQPAPAIEDPAAPPAQSVAASEPAPEVPAEVPPPTLQDVQALTAQSDFSRFVAPDVAPEVKSAALKKLFADPRYNVMDGLDVYVDDYSQPDPLPAHVARQLAGAAFLRLFDDHGQPQGGAQARDVADAGPADSVPQSRTDLSAAPVTDADPDLRLQQDDAAEGGDGRPGSA